MPSKDINEKYLFKDYRESFKTTVNFSKNKNISIHRWYPFVEGFSEEFIINILNEFGRKDIKCLEPFCGSGTTPLALQKQNIECISFEVSPFMHLLSSVKLRTDYRAKVYRKSVVFLEKYIQESVENGPFLLPPIMKSIVENENREKWLFDKSVMYGILDIKYGINNIEDKKYRNLFKIALASILLEISNVYRNGKCLSYKKDWNNKKIDRKDVHNLFIEKVNTVFLEDIDFLQKEKDTIGKLFSNHKNCIRGDVRKKLDLVDDNTIDLVITSPPYLNSRDYTDTYMIELWILDLVKDYSNVRKLRKNTIRSHVQVNWKSEKILDIDELKTVYQKILEHKDQFWNNSIPDMIIGYFNDMNILFNKLNRKIKKYGKIYLNVANSAYYGVNIQTDLIIAQIAEKNGFNIEEIRIARYIPPSSQQKDKIGYLRESIIVMSKK